MKVLVLGGTRFIGRRLVEVLLSAGDRVTLFSRGRTQDPFADRVERLAGDRRSAPDLDRALTGREFDAAFDFLSYTADDARAAIDALAGHVGHFVHISTCSVYWCTGDFPCPVPEEEFERFGDFAKRPASIEYEYGYGKRKAEETLFAAHREAGFPITAIRLPVVGGEGDLSLRYASYCLRVGDGGPLALPDGGFVPLRHVYVGDVARALAALPSAPHAIGQAYNLAGAEILSVRSIVASIASVMGRQVETVEVPTAVLKGMGLGTEFSPFSQQAPQVPAIYKARRDLGWSPTPWAVWLDRAVRWSLDAAGRTGPPPHAYTYRAAELDAIARYRAVTAGLCGGDATSAGPRG